MAPTGQWASTPGSPFHVIGVEMAEYQQRDAAYAEGPQASGHECRIGSGVDDDSGVRRGAQHESVTLPDVADDELPPGRWPRSRDDMQRKLTREHAGHRACRGSAQRWPPP